jgi:puromycin-sensitive aminopeptidase
MIWSSGPVAGAQLAPVSRYRPARCPDNRERKETMSNLPAGECREDGFGCEPVTTFAPPGCRIGNEVVVVLGGGLSKDGTPSAATLLRAEAAAKLAMQNQQLTVIILSGSKPLSEMGEDDQQSEAAIMAGILRQHGVEQQRLLLEDESVDTIGNAVLVTARYLWGIEPRKLYLVTSPFHARRAALLFGWVLGDGWQVVPVESAQTDDDAMRAASEAGGISWAGRFFRGIKKGDLPAIIRRLQKERPYYATLSWLDADHLENHCCLLAGGNHSSAASAAQTLAVAQANSVSPNHTEPSACTTCGATPAATESEDNHMCMSHDDNVQVTADRYRLPATVVPEHYALTLRPDLKSFTFAGGEVIDIRVKEAVSEIVLNAAELTISDAYVTDAAGCRLNGTVSLDEETERAIIRFDGVVGKGSWKLHLSFAGVINNKLHGFYRSLYRDGEGKQHVIASTQFEPNDARRAFPCFDEPGFKAKFSVTLVVDPELTALANGAIIKETLVQESPELSIDYGNGLKYVVAPAVTKKVVEFKTTMKMSTYLVAFVVGQFEASEVINVNGTEVRVWCTPGKKHLSTFALKAAQFSIAWYERYFGIKYPGGKMDMVAIPDFAFGAMENTGLITYRETALLVDELTATIAELERVAEVVAHEIAHQWFGNLVTMKWWNGLWLNEAFATFMATKVENDFYPQWNRWGSFAIERAAAFKTDGLGATRPIEAAVTNPAQALGMIDVITYRKGCSVLRQLEQYIGEETFRKGIAAYLRKHSYGNAETTDLWDAIDSVSPLPVRQIMDSWIFQPGYPMVTVSQSDVAGSVTLSQRPFKYLADQVDASLSWLVPVHLRYKTDEGVQSQWLLLADREQTVYLGENLQWVVANAGGFGFYRTLYSPELAAKLTADVQANLTSVERFNLVNDSWACCEAGLISASQYLDIVKLFAGETDPNVWSNITESLERLAGVVPAEGAAGYQALVRQLARPTFKRLGWQAQESENPADRQVRGTIISLLGTVGGDSHVQTQADKLFTAYQQDKSAVAADVVPAVVKLVAHTGDQSDHARFKAMTGSTNVPQEAVRYLQALAHFQDEQLLADSLQALVDGTARTQDAPQLAVRLLSNRVIAQRAWQFIKDNWDYMLANYPETGLIKMVSGVSFLDFSPELEQDVLAFFTDHKVKGGDKAVAQALEQLHINVLFNERERAPLAALFAPSN